MRRNPSRHERRDPTDNAATTIYLLDSGDDPIPPKISYLRIHVLKARPEGLSTVNTKCSTSAAAVLTALLAMLSSSCRSSSSTTTPSPPEPTTVLTFYRPADTFIAAESGTYTRANAAFEASMRSDVRGMYLMVTVRPTADSTCQLFLAPARGQALAAGSYPATMRWPVWNQHFPGLDFGCCYGCNISDGNFVIRELSPVQLGSIQRLDVTFEQTCHGFGVQGDYRRETLTGHLRILP